MTAIQDLKIRGSIVSPSSPSYEQAISRVSEAAILRAAHVVYPIDTSDVVEILRFVRSQSPPLDIAVKCGGHDASGASSSEGGIVIDLARINHIKVSEDKKTVAVGGGALWGAIYDEVEKYDLEVVGGAFGSIGIGGFTTGGGYSVISCRHGLAIDNLVQATVVLANGTVVTCSAEKEADLFWAIRGAGSQFGIIVEFVLKVYPSQGPVQMGVLAYPGTELPTVLKALREHLVSHQPGSKLVLCFNRSPPNYLPGLAIIPYVEGSPEKAEQILSPFSTRLQPVFQHVTGVPGLAGFARSNDHMLETMPGPRRFITGMAAFSDLWDDVVTAIFHDWVAFTSTEERKTATLLWEFGHPKKIAEVAVDATAFPTRVPHYFVIITGSHASPEDDAVGYEWVAKTVNYIKKTNIDKTGISIPTPAYSALQGHEDVADVYGKNYARLRKLKAKYDPEKVWNKRYTIVPDFE